MDEFEGKSCKMLATILQHFLISCKNLARVMLLVQHRDTENYALWARSQTFWKDMFLSITVCSTTHFLFEPKWLTFQKFFTSTYWATSLEKFQRIGIFFGIYWKTLKFWKFSDIKPNNFSCCCQNSILRVQRNILGAILHFEIFRSFEYFLDSKWKKFGWCCNNCFLCVQKHIFSEKSYFENSRKFETFFFELQRKLFCSCCQNCILCVQRNLLADFLNFFEFLKILPDQRWNIFGRCCQNSILRGQRNIFAST